ncbi:MAG: TetR/AcrR family transcriptional regulator [Bryobacteraceae bacterium]
MSLTRDRILDAAERLFAEEGFDATSIRSITESAGANLASVNYYFQSKDALIQAVFSRRLGPLNQRRLAMLAAVEESSGDGPPQVEGVLRALFEPPFRMSSTLHGKGRSFACLLGRVFAEPGDLFARIVEEQFGEIRQRFVAALRRALPELPDVELMWRVHFLIGTMAHTLTAIDHVPAISGGLCDPRDVDGMVERMIGFAAAGLRAPLPALSKGGLE